MCQISEQPNKHMAPIYILERLTDWCGSSPVAGADRKRRKIRARKNSEKLSMISLISAFTLNPATRFCALRYYLNRWYFSTS